MITFTGTIFFFFLYQKPNKAAAGCYYLVSTGNYTFYLLGFKKINLYDQEAVTNY